MADDCSFRLGGLSCEASNFVMASLGILVCFLAALIVFTGIGLLLHFLILWVNRRRSRDLTGESDLGRLRSFLASLFGSSANGPTSDVPLGPRNSRIWTNLNLLADMAPPPSYDEAIAMVDLSSHADGPDGPVPSHADGLDGPVPSHDNGPGDEDGEQGADVDQTSNGDCESGVGIWV